MNRVITDKAVEERAKELRRAYQRKWRKEHAEQVRQYNKKWRDANREEWNRKHREWYKAYKEEHGVDYETARLKRRAEEQLIIEAEKSLKGEM